MKKKTNQITIDGIKEVCDALMAFRVPCRVDIVASEIGVRATDIYHFFLKHPDMLRIIFSDTPGMFPTITEVYLEVEKNPASKEFDKRMREKYKNTVLVESNGFNFEYRHGKFAFSHLGRKYDWFDDDKFKRFLAETGINPYFYSTDCNGKAFEYMGIRFENFDSVAKIAESNGWRIIRVVDLRNEINEFIKG